MSSLERRASAMLYHLSDAFSSSSLNYCYLVGAAGIVYVFYHAFLSPLAYYPGPILARLSRLWLAYHGYKGDFHSVLTKLHEKHGNIVRIGPNELSIIEPQSVRKIYGFGTNFEKSDWYSVSHGTRKFDLFAEQREKVHRVQRRLVNDIYSTASLKRLESRIDSTISHFVQLLRQRPGRSLDLGEWLQLVAFDLVGEVTFSRRFGLMDVGKETETLKEIKRALRSAAWVSQIPFVFKIHEFLEPLVGNHLAATARNGSIREFTGELVKIRLAQNDAERDMVEQLLNIHQAKSDEFQMQDVVSMATTNVFAGSDTTAISLRAIIYFILRHPECKKKLIDEVDSYANTNSQSESFSYDTAMRMPYLQAVMYEALRLHPVVGQTLPRVVPSEGLQCRSRHVPAGTIVGTSPYVLSRSKEIFGENAHLFHPERWLQPNKGELQRFWLPFGGGSRTCIGKNLSWMEMSKLIPTLFRHFDIRLTDPNAELCIKCFFFLLQTGLNVVIQPRHQENTQDT